MKSYSTIVHGKDMGKVIDLPDEYKNLDLQVVIKPIVRKKKRFTKLLANPIRVKNIVIPSRDDIHER